MTGSRHRRSEGSGEPTDLPSWAQRHLDEIGTSTGAALTTTRRRRTAGRPVSDSPLRGWGLAILSVAAAVTAVPLAITAVANDRSDEPLPTVDTFTAGAPGPLQNGQGGASPDRRGTTGVSGDQASAGVFDVPGAPGAVAPAPAPVVVPVPQPAAVVRPTTPPAPITPRSAAPPAPTTGTTTPTRTTTSDDADDADEGRNATKPTSTKQPTSSSDTPKTSGDGGRKQDKGLLGNTVETAGNVVGGVAKNLL